jgi:hypothetical protein
LSFAILVTPKVLAPRAKFVAQENILDAARMQGSLQFFAVKLRIDATVGHGPYIAKGCDIVSAQ